MAKLKPTLNSADIELLKDVFPTEKRVKYIVNEIVIDASHAMLEGVQRMFDDQNKDINKRFKNVDERFDHLETKIKNVENHLRDDINGLKADLSTTVSKGEFNRLKAKVDKYVPAS